MKMNPIASPTLTVSPVTTEALHVPVEAESVYLDVSGAVTIPQIFQPRIPTGGFLWLYAKSTNGGDVTIPRTAKASAVEGSVTTNSGSNIVLNPDDAVLLVKRANGSFMDVAFANPS